MKKVIKIAGWFLFVLFIVVGLVYIFYQFETFSPDQPDLTFYEAFWLTILNPTGLTGSGFTFPETLPGKFIGIFFVLISISLFGVFIGKIGDMFTEYREYRKLGYHGTDFTDHYVIIGWDNLARLVTKELVLSDQQVVIVTDQKEDIDLIYDEFDKHSVFVLYTSLNNYKNLKKANLQNCHRLLINDPSDKDTLVNLLNIKANENFKNTDCLVTIQEEQMRETFIGRPETDDSDRLSGRPDVQTKAYWAYSLFRPASNLFASIVFEPLSAEFLLDLITSVNNENDNDEEYELQLYQVTEGDDFHHEDTDFGYAFDYIYFDGETGRDYEYQCMPVGISKRLDGSKNLTADREVKILPAEDTPVEAGDYLILIVKGSWMDKLERDFNNPQGLNPEDRGKVDWTRLSLFQNGDQRGGAENDSLEDYEKGIQDHIVILGWDKVSKLITDRLIASHQKVVIVTEEKSKTEIIEDLFPASAVRAVYRNLANYGRLDDDEVNITESKRVFVNLDTDEENLVAIMNLEERFGVTPMEGDDNLNVVSTIANPDLERSFITAGVTYAVSVDVINSKLITSYLYEEDVAFVAEDLLAGTEQDGDTDLQQYMVNDEAKCSGSTYKKTVSEIKDKFGCFVVGIAKEDEEYHLKKLPENPGKLTIDDGDYLLILVRGEAEKDLQNYMAGSEGHLHI